MKKKINQKGISLISLSIMVMVILAITGTIIYNVKNNLKVERLEQMQDDIENLQDKVDTYYAQYGKIPAKTDVEYTNIAQMQEAGIISTAVDTGKFYILDLSAIENLTLNFGQDYEIVKSLTSETEINRYDNLYIINENSHNIFFPKGITLDKEVFYTNYRVEDVDTEAVNLRYVDNIKIPEGYHYISGNKVNGIIIQNDSTSERYKWIMNNSEISTIPEGVSVDNEAEFIKSANLFDGYYQGVTDTTKVIYLPIEEKWSDTYDKTGIYKDINEDVAYIPKGFQVSQTPGMDVIQDGLVIRDEDGNQFVWVPVEDSRLFVRSYWENWSGNLEEEPEGDDYFSDCKENETTYEYTQMKNSVTTYGGFYVARYEAGITDTSNKSTQDGTVKPVSKNSTSVWNNIPWGGTYDKAEAIDGYQGNDKASGAVKVARSMYPDTERITEYALPATATNNTGVKSTLIYGVQWDAIMRWMKNIENSSATKTSPQNKYILDSTGKGNYYDSDDTNNPAATGTNNYEVKNICDMAGNVDEWTMEAYDTDGRVDRGGDYYYSGSGSPASIRGSDGPDLSSSYIGFRVTLYLDV